RALLVRRSDRRRACREEGRGRDRVSPLRAPHPAPARPTGSTAMNPPVAYPGPPGTHTAAEAVAAADAAFGVLPIESSIAGAVAETHDLLYERSLSIVAETVLPIRHALAAPAVVPLEEIRVVRSHPAAFEQCRNLLARLPNAQLVPAATTAEA